MLATNQSDYAEATKMLMECLAIRRELGNARETAATLSTLSTLHLQQGAMQIALAIALDHIFAMQNDRAQSVVEELCYSARQPASPGAQRSPLSTRQAPRSQELDDFFLRPEDFLLDEVFFPDDAFFLDEAFFLGTFAPARRASDSPIAIACFRLVTFFFDLPLFNVPLFRSSIAFLTFSCAFFPYLAIVFSWVGLPPI